MDHGEIDQFNIIDRYLMGKMPVEESADFEAHLIDCPQCITRLQMTDRFLQGLRSLAVEQAAPIGHHQPRRTFMQFLYAFFRLPVALAVACLLIVGVVVIWAINYTGRLRAEADQAKGLSEQWQRRFENEQQSAMAADRKRQETERQQTDQLRALEAKLKEEQEQRLKMAAEFRRQAHPESNLPIFILNSVRGGEPNSSAPLNRITLTHPTAVFAFSMSLVGETQFKSYRITIFDDRHRLIKQTGRLVPDQTDALSILLNPGRFRPGDYSLIIEGIKKEGGLEAVGNYPFRIIKAH